MKIVQTWFFVSLYLLAMAKPVLPLFQYLIDKDYIAEFLCVNKDKPELNCDGKCYLAKMLQKKKEDKKNNLPSINLQDYPLALVATDSFEKTTITNTANKRNNFYSNLYRLDFEFAIFHPPTI